jgi:hypothetical protein
MYGDLRSQSTSSLILLVGSSESSVSNLEVQHKTRLDLSTNSETSWSCQQVPLRASGIQYHRRLSPTLSNTLEFSSMIKDNNLLEVLGGCFFWIHEELHLDPLRLFRIKPINLVHLHHFGSIINRDSCAREGGKGEKYLGYLLMLLI